MYNECLGKIHFWLSVISFNITFFPMHFLGLAGMPRRIPDYALQFTNFNQIASIGAFIFGLSQLLFLYNIIQCHSPQRSKSYRSSLGGSPWTRMVSTITCALPYLYPCS